MMIYKLLQKHVVEQTTRFPALQLFLQDSSHLIHPHFISGLSTFFFSYFMTFFTSPAIINTDPLLAATVIRVHEVIILVKGLRKKEAKRPYAYRNCATGRQFLCSADTSSQHLT